MISKEQLQDIGNEFTLKTERLTLRRFQPSDMEEEIQAQQDPQVVRYIRQPMSREQAVEFFQHFTKAYEAKEDEWLGICVVRTEDDQVLGGISFKILSFNNEVAEIGYRFNPLYQGKGYAIEAIKALVTFVFGSVKVNKIVAYCDSENTASYKLMEKLSMRKEGHLRAHNKIAEQYRDMLVYGLLKSEFNFS